MTCIFCNIVRKTARADLLYEDHHVIAFHDIAPKAPVHILIIPKKHIPALTDTHLEDEVLLGHLLLVAKQLAVDRGIARSGYKIVINIGRDGGQVVQHLHAHLLGGQKLRKLL